MGRTIPRHPTQTTRQTKENPGMITGTILITIALTICIIILIREVKQ